MKQHALYFALIIAASCTTAKAASVKDLLPGHFVQIRGTAQSGQTFNASKVTLLQPDDEAALVGKIKAVNGKQPSLLGYPLRANRESELRGLQRNALAGEQVKAEGKLDAAGVFIVETLSSRGPGRDRLEGAITAISKRNAMLRLQVLGHSISLHPDTPLVLDGDLALPDYQLELPARRRLASAAPDDDDRFGDGFVLSDTLRLSARIEAESDWEDNLNFDDSDNEDRKNLGVSTRVRLEWQPDNGWFGVSELRYELRHRERQDRRRQRQRELELGEAYLGRHLSDNTRLILGRQDFDDDREFLFDENLDAVRLNTRLGPFQIDASVSRIFADDSSLEEDADNLFVYVSNMNQDHQLAAYWLYRDYAREFDEETYHLGVRAMGAWLPTGELWLELVHQGGKRQGRTVSAWAFDLGNTWYLDAEQRWYAMTGLALASGDDPNTHDDELFRQTGLQDNNGRFGGVTSYRYYGEGADPELSNLLVSTLGIGHRLTEAISVDLVGHQYRLHQQSGESLAGNWDSDLSGRSKNLGWATDLVFGYRGPRRWEVEGVFGYLHPNSGFEDSDAGWLGKLQVKLRY